MADLLSLSAVEARAALDAGEVSAPELTGAYLAAIEETGALNNYVAVTADKAMEMAEASQARIKAGEAGLIEGIPVGVKDLFCTAGVASTACLRMAHRKSMPLSAKLASVQKNVSVLLENGSATPATHIIHMDIGGHIRRRRWGKYSEDCARLCEM